MGTGRWPIGRAMVPRAVGRGRSPTRQAPSTCSAELVLGAVLVACRARQAPVQVVQSGLPARRCEFDENGRPVRTLSSNAH